MGKEEENNDSAMPRRESETKFVTIFERRGSKNTERKTMIDNLVPKVQSRHDICPKFYTARFSG